VSAAVVEWLQAKLARVEETARAAGGDAWAVAADGDTVALYDSRREPVVYDEGWPSEAQQQHIALHDPTAVLRQVAAARAILDEHANDYGDCTVCARASDESDGRGSAFHEPLPWPCRTVLLLAEGWGWTAP
jgi:hypothetical protein